MKTTFYTQRYSFNRWRYIKNDTIKKLQKEYIPSAYLENLAKRGEWYMYNEWLTGHDNL